METPPRMPAPSRVTVDPAVTSRLKPPPEKTIRSMRVSERDGKDRSVMDEELKMALSLGPFGTVWGIQLSGVYQSPETGFGDQAMLRARLVVGAKLRATNAMANDRIISVCPVQCVLLVRL